MKSFLVPLLFCSTIAHAAVLSDDLSPVQSFDLDAEWRHPDSDNDDLDDNQLNALVTYVNHVEVRLDTSAYTGSTARIYLSMPIIIRGLSDINSFRLSWTGNGRFSDGTVTPGMRTLIYDGPIQDKVTTDILNFTIDLDGRAFNQPIEFEPIYEIETSTP